MLIHEWLIGQLASCVDDAIFFGSRALDPVAVLHQRRI